MNSRAVLRVLGFVSVVLGTAMVVPAVMAFLRPGEDVVPLLAAAAVPLVVGTLTLLATPGPVDLRIRDGFAIVTFAWVTAAVFGTLPYVFSGVCGPIDALFESMSGFTTTGATILPDVEGLPRSILLWRSQTQWIGGMGIVLISVAVLPLLGVGGMQLFRAEVPGPVTDRLSPRIQSTAKTLWGVYVFLTVAEIALLMTGGMSLFEATCHSFCTVSTGGFSTRNASIGAYGSAYIESVVIVFMFLAGVNFSLHFWLLRLRWKPYINSEEVRLYTWIAVAASGLIWLSLYFQAGEGATEAVRHSLFQTVSIFTTTGFGTADFHQWAYGAQILLFLLMFMGACTGSTSGGMKVMRVILLAKYGMVMAKKEVHPRAVFTIRYAGKSVSDEVMLKILGFFLFFMFCFFAISLAVAAVGVDVETAVGATIAALSNIGPGLGQVGPSSTYAPLPPPAKLILVFSMLLGRLELYTVLVVLSPMFWRRT